MAKGFEMHFATRANMDKAFEQFLSVDSTNAYYIFAAGLVAVVYYTWLPQGSIYGNFKRAGTTLGWKSVHDVVQGGYDTVRIPPADPSSCASLVTRIDDQGIGKAICGEMVGKRLPYHACKVSCRAQGRGLVSVGFLPEHQRRRLSRVTLWKRRRLTATSPGSVSSHDGWKSVHKAKSGTHGECGQERATCREFQLLMTTSSHDATDGARECGGAVCA